MSEYQCPVCGVCATIDGQKITIKSQPDPFLFPTHADCELAKPASQIDLSKLAKVS